MIALWETATVFTALVVLHTIWFRVRRPRTEMRALLWLFSAGLGLLLVSLETSRWASAASDAPSESGRPLVLTSFLLYLALAVCYIAVYQGFTVVGPSAKILMLVASHPASVLTYAELRRALTDNELILPRLNDLVSAGLVTFDGTHYRLRPRGALLAEIAAAYRALLRKGFGG